MTVFVTVVSIVLGCANILKLNITHPAADKSFPLALSAPVACLHHVQVVGVVLIGLRRGAAGQGEAKRGLFMIVSLSRPSVLQAAEFLAAIGVHRE